MASRRSLSAVLAASAALLAAVIAVAPGVVAGDDDRTRTYVIDQEPPTLHVAEVVAADGAHGEILAFDASITAEDGRSGRLHGLLTVSAVREGGAVRLEDRIGQIVFDLGDGDSLMVIGGSIYAVRGAEMEPGREQVRVVAGGTGDFIGARGEVATVRAADGSYTHTFTLLED